MESPMEERGGGSLARIDRYRHLTTYLDEISLIITVLETLSAKD